MSPIAEGYSSPHRYRLRRGQADYFVKKVDGHESDIQRRLIPLKLSHIPRVVCPDLLGVNVLVSEYVSGGPATSKELEPSLIQEYAVIQNRVDPVGYWTEGGTEDTFLGDSMLRCCEGAERVLVDLCARGLTSARRHADLLAALIGEKLQSAQEYNRVVGNAIGPVYTDGANVCSGRCQLGLISQPRGGRHGSVSHYGQLLLTDHVSAPGADPADTVCGS